MAKYFVNRTSKGTKYANCSVLDYNPLNESYTVRFDNGILKDVPTRKVSDLDRLDEAVLDNLKNFAAGLWDNIVKRGKYLVLKFKNLVFNIQTPVNIMQNAKTSDFAGFIPSEQLAALAEDNGIQAEAVMPEIDTAIQVSKKEDEAAAYAMNVWLASVIEDSVASHMQYESVKRVGKRLVRTSRINEDANTFGETNMRNVTRNEVYSLLNTSLHALIKNGAGRVWDGQKPATPLVIWGAPGVGKTDIIKNLVDRYKTRFPKFSLVYLNLAGQRKDDFVLPSTNTVKQKIKTAEGKVVEIERGISADIVKSWIPTFDMNDLKLDNSLTVDMLDDIANGGDGTGTGEGGIIFLDEFSRADEGVLDVMMTLMQQRVYLGTNYIGSKWLIVGAANRTVDMGERTQEFNNENAIQQRSQNVFLQPSFAEWLEWAESPIKGTNRPHIMKPLVDYLKANPDMWYNVAMKMGSFDAQVDLYPNPRAWEQLSISLDKLIDRVNDAIGDDFWAEGDDQVRAYRRIHGNKQIGPDGLRNDDILQQMQDFMGKKTRAAASSYFNFDRDFTNDVAASVWELGDNAPITFTPSAATLQLAIDKILGNYNGDENEKISPEAFDNFINYVVKVCNSSQKESPKQLAPIMIKSIIDAVSKHNPKLAKAIMLADSGSANEYLPSWRKLHQLANSAKASLKGK